MRVAVIGDAMLDIAVHGKWSGTCPENEQVYNISGSHVDAYAGGAGNVATILTEQKATVDLYADGPGNGKHKWVGELFKSVVKVNKIVWSGYGHLPVKIRGYVDNEVVSRIDAEQPGCRNGKPSVIDNLLIDIHKYDAIIVSDYCKSVFDDNSAPLLRKIIERGNNVIIDSKRLGYSLWAGATAIVPNGKEAWRSYNSTDPTVVRNKAKVELVAITNDGKTVDVAWEDHFESMIVSRVQKPFNVGAGDAFAAGLAIGLGKGNDYADACATAMEIARKYVKKPRKCHLR